jgi:hypothetical protein
MKKAFGDYRLLARSNRRGGSLWQGPDHLLDIETNGFLVVFSESYRRIDYKNIQSITYVRTQTWIWLAILLGLFSALLLWGVLANLRDLPTLAAIFGVCATPCVIAFVVNLVKGPSCICKVQTAVQIRHLKPITRLRAAERLVKEIAPLCLLHQGGDAVTLGSLPPMPPPLSKAPEPSRVVPTLVELKPAWSGLPVVSTALGLLVASGLVTIADLFIKNLAYFVFDVMLALGAYVTSITGLMKARRFELPSSLKISLWGAMVSFVLFFVTGFALLVWAGISVGQKRDMDDEGSLAAYRFLSNAGMQELGWGAWVVIGLGAAAVFLGLFGLPAALWPAAKAAPPVAPPAPPVTESASPEFKP